MQSDSFAVHFRFKKEEGTCRISNEALVGNGSMSPRVQEGE
jgi:hypothetical protein